MNRKAEFHDSEVSSIAQDGYDVVISFNPLYIHQSEGRPGWDEGTGWGQDANLRILDARAPEFQSELPDDLGNGYLQVGDQHFDNMLPIPLQHVGGVEFGLTFAHTAEELIIRGSGVELTLLGEPKYVEEFPGADTSTAFAATSVIRGISFGQP